MLSNGFFCLHKYCFLKLEITFSKIRSSPDSPIFLNTWRQGPYILGLPLTCQFVNQFQFSNPALIQYHSTSPHSIIQNSPYSSIFWTIYSFEFPPRFSANNVHVFAVLANHSIGWQNFLRFSLLYLIKRGEWVGQAKWVRYYIEFTWVMY